MFGTNFNSIASFCPSSFFENRHCKKSHISIFKFARFSKYDCRIIHCAFIASAINYFTQIIIYK